MVYQSCIVAWEAGAAIVKGESEGDAGRGFLVASPSWAAPIVSGLAKILWSCCTAERSAVAVASGNESSESERSLSKPVWCEREETVLCSNSKLEEERRVPDTCCDSVCGDEEESCITGLVKREPYMLLQKYAPEMSQYGLT